MIRRYTQLETLDAQTLLLLVDRIEIGDATEISGVKARDVKVIYKICWRSLLAGTAYGISRREGVA
jgi:hypothetical protein